MLRRCTARPPICPRLRPPAQFPRARWQSTGPEQGHAATSNASKPPSKKWQLYVIGGLVGFTIGSWYRIVNSTQSRDSFQAFELLSKDTVSPTASIFTLKPKGKLESANEYAAAWKQGIWNVDFKQPQLQIVRAYTPLPPTDDDTTDDLSTLRFLIRRDARGGEMSSYLHRLPINSTIELRGPNIEYPIAKDVRNVVFIAGGTGIAPAMQVAHAMFDGLSEKQKKEKSLHILWGNRKREDCAGAISDGQLINSTPVQQAKSNWFSVFSSSKPDTMTTTTTTTTNDSRVMDPEQNLMVRELNNLKSIHGNNIHLTYFVDEEKSYITTNTIQDVISHFKAMPTGENAVQTHIIISGPPGFITYLAGPKVWQDGQEQQGPLGGRLAQALGKDDRNDVKVWKV